MRTCEPLVVLSARRRGRTRAARRTRSPGRCSPAPRGTPRGRRSPAQQGVPEAAAPPAGPHVERLQLERRVDVGVAVGPGSGEARRASRPGRPARSVVLAEDLPPPRDPGRPRRRDARRGAAAGPARCRPHPSRPGAGSVTASASAATAARSATPSGRDMGDIVSMPDLSSAACGSRSSAMPASGWSTTAVAVVLDPGVFADSRSGRRRRCRPDHPRAPRPLRPDLLAATDAPIFTIDAVAAKIREDAPDIAERVTVVAPGETFDAGLPVRAVGELHAVIHPEFPRFFNSGYVLSARRPEGLPPRRRADRPRRARRRAVRAGLRAVAEDLGGHRLRPRWSERRATSASTTGSTPSSPTGSSRPDGPFPRRGQEYARIPDGTDL